MDPILFKESADRCPKHNRMIAEGVAVSQMRLARQYVDHVMRCAAQSFPPGLQYLGSEQCSPEEQLRVITNDRNKQKRSGGGKLEISRSDVYLMKYHFAWQGEKLEPKYLFLPFVGEAGTMHIRGPVYTVSPVLADLAFSVTKEGIFVPFTRDRLTFRRLAFNYIADNRVESSYVIWSAIHKYMADRKGKAGPSTCLPHYLFAKCGVHDAFSRYAGAEVVVGGSEICVENYPEKDWIIASSIGNTPRGHVKKHYLPTTVKLAVRRKDYKPLVQFMIAGFFYVADHYPERVKAQYCSDPRFWRNLLGHVLCPTEINEGKMMITVNQHMESLDEYVDDVVREMLVKAGADSRDIYEFFVYAMENINPIIFNVDPASTYGKRLDVVKYVLLDVVKAIFNFTYSLRSPGKKGLNLTTIKRVLGKNLNRDLVLTELSRSHGEVNIISCPGDNILMKFTSKVVLQTDATNSSHPKGRGSLSDPSKWLHASLAETGSFANQPKSEPTGKTNLNPCQLTDSDGTLIRREELRPLLDEVQRKISTR